MGVSDPLINYTAKMINQCWIYDSCYSLFCFPEKMPRKCYHFLTAFY